MTSMDSIQGPPSHLNFFFFVLTTITCVGINIFISPYLFLLLLATAPELDPSNKNFSVFNQFGGANQCVGSWDEMASRLQTLMTTMTTNSKACHTEAAPFSPAVEIPNVPVHQDQTHWMPPWLIAKEPWLYRLYEWPDAMILLAVT